MEIVAKTVMLSLMLTSIWVPPDSRDNIISSNNLISVQTCRGQIIKIDLGDENDPIEVPKHNQAPCHAICCDDDEDDENETPNHQE